MRSAATFLLEVEPPALLQTLTLIPYSIDVWQHRLGFEV